MGSTTSLKPRTRQQGAYENAESRGKFTFYFLLFEDEGTHYDLRLRVSSG